MGSDVRLNTERIDAALAAFCNPGSPWFPMQSKSSWRARMAAALEVADAAGSWNDQYGVYIEALTGARFDEQWIIVDGEHNTSPVGPFFSEEEAHAEYKRNQPHGQEYLSAPTVVRLLRPAHGRFVFALAESESGNDPERLRTALTRYGKHHHGCPAEFANGSRLTKLGRLLSTGGFSLLTLPGECTCGLDDALAESVPSPPEAEIENHDYEEHQAEALAWWRSQQ